MVFLGWLFCIFIIDTHAAVNGGFKSYATTVKTFENDTVRLPCYVEDFDNRHTRVRWWRDGVLLADSDEPRHVPPERIRMFGNSSLEVSHVRRDDTGQYVCQATRPAPWGHATQVHEIEVMYPPSVQPVPESGQLEVNLTEEVSMDCVAKGVPSPIVTWTKDGDTRPLLYATRLRFNAVVPSLAGRYTCTANNDVGEPAAAHIDLTVKYKPKIEMPRTIRYAPPNIQVRLHCRVTAWPEAKVEWYFNNKSVEYSSRVVKHNAETDHSLLIRNVETSDYGTYVCRAANAMGVSEKAVVLSGTALLLLFKGAPQAVSRNSYKFVWDFYSDSPIVQYEFRFRKVDRKGVYSPWHTLYIPSGNRAFNLTGLEEATHYEALLLAKNRFGWSTPSEIIRFATAGAPPEDEKNYPTNPVEDAKQPAQAVQLASMSQQFSLEQEESGSSANRWQAIVLLIVLPALYTLGVNL